MGSVRAELQPLAIGAPAPPVQLPIRPLRSVHVFDPSNPRMVEKLPALAARADVLLANLEDGVPPERKAEARRSVVEIATRLDRGDAQLWVRVNALDAPWFLDDVLTLTAEATDLLDAVMLPKVGGPRDLWYLDRLLAQLEARAGARRPILIHALLESASGISEVERICGATLRLQGVSIGPADLAADRRMRTTRVGGGHPDYLVRTDPVPGGDRVTHLQDLWHYTVGRVVDACAAHGISPVIGPFGDIDDIVGCEDHFRRAAVMGCAGGWTLHPSQLPVAERVFSPHPSEVAWAERVVAALGTGDGSAVLVDGSMQDEATVRQCRVVLDTARLAARRNPDLAAGYGWSAEPLGSPVHEG